MLCGRAFLHDQLEAEAGVLSCGDFLGAPHGRHGFAREVRGRQAQGALLRAGERFALVKAPAFTDRFLSVARFLFLVFIGILLFAPISGTDHTNGIASQGEPHGEHAMVIMADGLEPRFVGAVCFVRDNYTNHEEVLDVWQGGSRRPGATISLEIAMWTSRPQDYRGSPDVTAPQTLWAAIVAEVVFIVAGHPSHPA